MPAPPRTVTYQLGIARWGLMLAGPFTMRLAFRICVALLLLAAMAESQEPAQPPLQPAVRPPRVQRLPRPQQPHNQDAWYPDPPPEGGANPARQQPYTPPAPVAAP